MTKKEALTATETKFTNLMDGSVLLNVNVAQIINYYESIMFNNTKTLIVNSLGNIESNFQQEEAYDYLDEADYWDGDESDNFLQ
jgi:hypothetical protein